MARSWHGRRTFVRVSIIAALLAPLLGIAGIQHAVAASGPTFQLPVACDETWQLKTYSGHPWYALDFKHSSGSSFGRDVITSATGLATTVEDRYSGTGGTSYGNYVIVDHGDGWTTLYAHLEDVDVKEGDPVRIGTKIGTVGYTGNTDDGSGGPFAHIHYEQRLNNVVQPATFDGSSWSYTSYWVSDTSVNCKMWNAAGHLFDATVFSRNSNGVSGAAHIDFDGNRKSDAFRTTGSQWKVRYNGTGSWQVLRDANPALEDLAFGDFNGDGVTDIFRATGNDTEVRYGGTGSWKNLSNINAKLRNLAFGDFDGDGKTDVFRSKDGDFEVQYGGKAPWVRLSGGNYTLGDLALADLDGDGKTDLFRTTGSEWKVRYGGTGSWQSLVNSTVELRDLAFAHINGDAKADVFRANGTKWRVRYGGTGAWQDLRNTSTPLHKIAFAGINADTQSDALRATGSDRWEVRYEAQGAWQDLSGSIYKLSDFIIG